MYEEEGIVQSWFESYTKTFFEDLAAGFDDRPATRKGVR